MKKSNQAKVKKICLSANTSWYLYNFRYSIIKKLKSEGFDIICLTPRDLYTEKLITELGITWYPLKINRSSTNPITEVISIISIILLYKKIRPDLCIHFTIKNNIYGTIAAKFIKTYIINNITGLGTAFLKKNILYYLASFLYKIILKSSNYVFCQNKNDYDFIKNCLNVSTEKIILTPGSGVNLLKFTNSNIKSPDKNNFIFLFVGRIIKDKGIVELIQAFNKIDKSKYPCKLIIAGDVDNGNKSTISSDDVLQWTSSDNITWLGNVNNMPELYNYCDCIILPSYREGLSKTLIEAGAMKLPAITTNVPGCQDIISDGINGFLCKVKNSEDLYTKMIKILRLETNQYTILADNARENVILNFDEDIVLEKTLTAIKSLNYQ